MVKKNKNKPLLLPPTATPKEEALTETEGRELLAKVSWLAAYLDRMNFAKYVDLMQSPRRIIFLNFLGGVGRGLGIAVGFTVLGFLLVYILNLLNVVNLPIIGDFISELLLYIESHPTTRV